MAGAWSASRGSVRPSGEKKFVTINHFCVYGRKATDSVLVFQSSAKKDGATYSFIISVSRRLEGDMLNILTAGRGGSAVDRTED